MFVGSFSVSRVEEFPPASVDPVNCCHLSWQVFYHSHHNLKHIPCHYMSAVSILFMKRESSWRGKKELMREGIHWMQMLTYRSHNALMWLMRACFYACLNCAWNPKVLYLTLLKKFQWNEKWQRMNNWWWTWSTCLKCQLKLYLHWETS